MKKSSGVPVWLVSVVVTAIVIATVLLLRFVMVFGLTPSDSQERWGQFGDFVGGILNPLFSIIGLVALLYTIKLQSEEMRNSTKELKSSAKALAKQNKHNARQQFDANFFQLIAMHQRVKATVRLAGNEGGAVVSQAMWSMQRVVNSNRFDVGTREGLEQLHEDWLHDYGGVFRGYLDSLINIFSYIYFAPVGKRARLFAYTALSSSLSIAELDLLLWSVTFDKPHKWARELLEEEEFFKYCSTSIFHFQALWKIVPDDESELDQSAGED